MMVLKGMLGRSVLALVLMAALATPARAEEAAGTVTGVDAVASPHTFTVAVDGGGTLTFNVDNDDVDPDTVFEVRGKDVTSVFADPNLGRLVDLRVHVVYTTDGVTNTASVVHILAGFRATAGHITAVDASGDPGSFSLARPHGGLDFLAVEDTRIRLSRLPGSGVVPLSALGVGDFARVQYADLGTVLVALDVKARFGGKPQKVIGVISALDGVNFTITVDARRGPDVTVAVAGFTVVQVNGLPGAFADLVVGMGVNVSYADRAGGPLALHVIARGP